MTDIFAKQLEVTIAANDRHADACRKFQADRGAKNLTAVKSAYVAKRIQQRRLLKIAEA